MTGKTKVKSFDALMAAAALPERSIEVCLRGDLYAQVEDLDRELVAARGDVTTMADAGRPRQIAKQIEQLREQMQAATATFRLRGLTRRAYADLLTAHPPRKDNRADAEVGYNTETFFSALIRACLVDPALDDDQWERLDGLLTSGQFEEIADAALAVSRRKVGVPFSYAASETLRSSDATSK